MGFYPSGHNTFARLVPSDAAQAQGMVTYMRSLGVTRLFVLEDVSSTPSTPMSRN